MTIAGVVREEAASWRGKRKSLTFGFSAAEIESALAELEEIQQELLDEEDGANTVRDCLLYTSPSPRDS